MNKHTFVFAALACSLLFALSCPAQPVTEEAKKPSPEATTGKETPAETSKKEVQPVVIRLRVMKKVDLSGTITRINPSAGTMSLRSRGTEVTFDMARPVLIGYKSLKEIRVGDAVSVAYTQFGTEIRKGLLAPTHRAAYIQRPAAVEGVKKSRKGGPMRMARTGSPTTFRDVDNNKDGKISPIELCVMMPDLTPEKFKEYDRNHDGCLDQAEFNAIKRNQ